MDVSPLKYKLYIHCVVQVGYKVMVSLYGHREISSETAEVRKINTASWFRVNRRECHCTVPKIFYREDEPLGQLNNGADRLTQ